MSKFAWKRINWTEVHQRVDRTQRRIYKASLEKNKEKVTFLQNLLIHSLDAKLIAVKRVTTENRSCQTTHIENTFYNTDTKKINLVKKLKINGVARCDFVVNYTIKRIAPNFMHKKLNSGKRKNNRRVEPFEHWIEDRAKQHLVLMALEPEWESKFEPNSYGLRPGRSCHDAVVAILGYLKVGRNKHNFKKYILDANLKGCFDNINHQYLLEKLDTSPLIRKQIRAWLEAGILKNFNTSDYEIMKNNIKTPPDVIISSLLINIILHGMENHLQYWISTFSEPKLEFPGDMKLVSRKNSMSQLGVIRYADNFILIHKDNEILKHAKITLQLWLKQTSGIEFHDATISIIRSTEGFKFLGYRFINVKSYNRIRLKIYPEKQVVNKIINHIGNILRTNRSISSYDLILKLKPIITGYCNYYSICECSHLFNKLDHLTFQMLRAWVFRRDKMNNRHKVKEKYFPSGNTYVYYGKSHRDNWVLVGTKKLKNGQTKNIFLPKFSWAPSIVHIGVRPIQPFASIYDGNKQYWEKRKLTTV